MEVEAGLNNGKRPPIRGYHPWRPQAKTRAVMAQVEEVLEEYEDHLPLTIRSVLPRHRPPSISRGRVHCQLRTPGGGLAARREKTDRRLDPYSPRPGGFEGNHLCLAVQRTEPVSQLHLRPPDSRTVPYAL